MKMLNRILILSFISAFWFLNGQNIETSPHNLSVGGTGTVKASSETEICIFCHTPHNSSSRQPLWNKKDPTDSYTLYSSSTQQSTSQTPDGGSLLCLSCHDGTIALGEVLSRTEIIAFTGGITVMPSGRTDLTKFLADDHPISIVYDAALAAADVELVDPSTLIGPVKLKEEKVQCTSCHDPHDNLIGDFLVESNQFSQLCEHCHQKTGWSTASHKNSGATWNGNGNDPWFHTPFTSVNENACENCHNPHLAQGEDRILNYLNEEDNCLECHNGNVALENIQSDILKITSRHDVYNYLQIHIPNEDLPVQPTLNMHVECVDCHNPHMADGTNIASAPDIDGPLKGVSGINSSGNPVSNAQYEYEICYKCHAESSGKPGSFISRQIEQNNVRLEFVVMNPSFHPVEGPGQNINVPSLIPPYTVNSIIYCSDCHSSNNSSANGPHGSDYAPILKYQYITIDNTPETATAYELCYQCHDRDKIINDTNTEFGKKIHQTHIVDENTPCSVCHDAHGISNTQGSSTNNSHLINFDVSVVSISTGMQGRLEFINDPADFAGECYLKCHGKNHNPKGYANQ